MPEPHETPLRAVEADPALVRKLGELWISSADQVVAVAATPGGLETLARGLDVDVDAARQLVAAAREALTPERVAELEAPVDSAQYGLGALRPPAHPEEEPDL